ncbi:MAG: peroxide stress protein YaaA [Acidimicrobiales bacterium]
MPAPAPTRFINLASTEYFGAVDTAAVDGKVVTPIFLDADADGEYRTVGFFAKRARGTMAGWIITERIKSVRALRDSPAWATASIPNVRRLINRSSCARVSSPRRRPSPGRPGLAQGSEQRLLHHNLGRAVVAQLEFESEQSPEVGDEDIPVDAIPARTTKGHGPADHIEDLELVGILVEAVADSDARDPRSDGRVTAPASRCRPRRTLHRRRAR